MSENMFTSTECVIIIAYLCYLQSVNREQTDRPPTEKEVSEFGPPRREKGSDSIKRPDYTLKDLLDQVKENSSHDEIDTGPPVGNEVW